MITATNHTANSGGIGLADNSSQDIKVSSPLTRLFHSTVAKYVVCFLSLTAITVVVGPVNSALMLSIAAIGIGLLAGTAAFHRKRLIYEISLSYSVARNAFSDSKAWHWWDQITDDLILGALPLKNLRHYKEINADAVLSLIEDFEFSSLGLISEPVTPDDWKTLKVPHLHLRAVDFQPLTLETLRKGVKWIELQIKMKRRVYIHCKAGRSRSAAMVIAYLAKKEGKSAEEVLAQIKAIRLQVSVGPEKMKSVKQFLNAAV